MDLSKIKEMKLASDEFIKEKTNEFPDVDATIVKQLVKDSFSWLLHYQIQETMKKLN